ncbi:MAG: ATP-binding cassette domain-containing protein [Sulfolobales archaeon]
MRIALYKISKFFDSFKALDNVSIFIGDREIIGLVGENGAGKTTLLNILYGLYKPTSGIIEIDGVRFKSTSPKIAREKSLFYVQQFPRLVETMNGVENLALISKLGYNEARRTLEEYSNKYGISVDYRKTVAQMTIVERQKLYTLIALSMDAKILLLDEPNTLLTTDQTFKDFLIKFSREKGSIVISTHKLRVILDLADRLYVMRRGRVVGEFRENIKNSFNEILYLMFGEDKNTLELTNSVARDKNLESSYREESLDENILDVERLVVRDDFQPIDLKVKKREVLSILTIAGRGDRELFELLAGLSRPRSGVIRFRGVDISRENTYKRVLRGIFYVPDNRFELLSPRYKIREVMSLWRIASDKSKKCLDMLSVVYRDLESRISELSGGNITRLILSLILCNKPSLIIAHNIFGGLDLASFERAVETIRDLKREGLSFLLILNDLEEALRVSDRIAVLNERGYREVDLNLARAEPSKIWRVIVS